MKTALSAIAIIALPFSAMANNDCNVAGPGELNNKAYVIGGAKPLCVVGEKFFAPSENKPTKCRIHEKGNPNNQWWTRLDSLHFPGEKC